MKIAAKAGTEKIAMVYVGEFEDGELVEFVEAVQPPKSQMEKWVIMISTLYGCPVECKMCDAGGFYHGKISKERLFRQIDYLVYKHYQDGNIPCKQFKIQFARMGEPSFNREVLQVLRELPYRYTAPGLMPSLSTIAPAGVDNFFDELLEIKNELYSNGNFQFQFSLHTSDEKLRQSLIPVKTWTFEQMRTYGDRFYDINDRKITLNFALASDNPVESSTLLKYFDPEKFLIKITPLNPTYTAQNNGLNSYINTETKNNSYAIVDELKAGGYDVIVSIGEVEENRIGSNCGQYVLKHVMAETKLGSGYLYNVEKIS